MAALFKNLLVVLGLLAAAWAGGCSSTVTLKGCTPQQACDALYLAARDCIGYCDPLSPGKAAVATNSSWLGFTQGQLRVRPLHDGNVEASVYVEDYLAIFRSHSAVRDEAVLAVAVEHLARTANARVVGASARWLTHIRPIPLALDGEAAQVTLANVTPQQLADFLEISNPSDRWPSGLFHPTAPPAREGPSFLIKGYIPGTGASSSGDLLLRLGPGPRPGTTVLCLTVQAHQASLFLPQTPPLLRQASHSLRDSTLRRLVLHLMRTMPDVAQAE